MTSLRKKSEPITIMYMIDTNISPPDTPFKGGTESQLYMLASSLSPIIFKPIVVQLSRFKSLPVAAGNVGALKVLHFPTSRLYGLQCLHDLRRLSHLANSEGVDIIHTFFEKSEVMGWLIARLSGIPIWITSRRDMGFKRKKIYDGLFRFAAKDCKRCIANSYAIKDQLLQWEGLPEEKIEVIYNGLDFSRFQNPFNGQNLRKNLGIEDHRPLVGMVANFYLEIKGHRYFMEAAKIVLNKLPNVEFLLIGDGTLRHLYEEMAFKMGIGARVHFLGKRQDIPNILSNLNISVLSSISEGLSNVILESMAAGRPVIATRVGGNSELVVDEITGYLIPPADSSAMAEAIIGLLQNPDKAKAMGAAGRKVVQEKFTVEGMVRKYEEVYFSLLKNRG